MNQSEIEFSKSFFKGVSMRFVSKLVVVHMFLMAATVATGSIWGVSKKDIQREILALDAILDLAEFSGSGGAMWGAIYHKPQWRPGDIRGEDNGDELYVRKIERGVAGLLANPIHSASDSMTIRISKEYVNPLERWLLGRYARSTSGWEKAREIATNIVKRSDQEGWADNYVWVASREVVKESIGNHDSINSAVKVGAVTAWEKTMAYSNKIHRDILNGIGNHLLADHQDIYALMDELNQHLNSERFLNSLPEVQLFYRNRLNHIEALVAKL